MADKGIGAGNCPDHGEYYLDAEDSPCPSCEDGGLAVYQIQIIDEIKASSPETALRVFLSRLRDEETTACVEHLQSGEIVNKNSHGVPGKGNGKLIPTEK